VFMEQVRILTNIDHGRGFEIFKLKPDQCIPANFFTLEQREHLVNSKAIELIQPAPSPQELVQPNPEKPKIQQPQDLSIMSVAETIEFLDTVVDVVQLEKYLDQEEGQKSRVRKRVTKFIENRIKDLQGTE